MEVFDNFFKKQIEKRMKKVEIEIKNESLKNDDISDFTIERL